MDREPGFPRKVLTFTKSIYRFLKSGKDLLPESKIMIRFEICKECELFTGRKCKLCGCSCNRQTRLLNKLAYPDEHCPDTPPKW